MTALLDAAFRACSPHRRGASQMTLVLAAFGSVLVRPLKCGNVKRQPDANDANVACKILALERVPYYEERRGCSRTSRKGLPGNRTASQGTGGVSPSGHCMSRRAEAVPQKGYPEVGRFPNSCPSPCRPSVDITTAPSRSAFNSTESRA